MEALPTLTAEEYAALSDPARAHYDTFCRKGTIWLYIPEKCPHCREIERMADGNYPDPGA